MTTRSILLSVLIVLIFWGTGSAGTEPTVTRTVITFYDSKENPDIRLTRSHRYVEMHGPGSHTWNNPGRTFLRIRVTGPVRVRRNFVWFRSCSVSVRSRLLTQGSKMDAGSSPAWRIWLFIGWRGHPCLRARFFCLRRVFYLITCPSSVWFWSRCLWSAAPVDGYRGLSYSHAIAAGSFHPAL